MKITTWNINGIRASLKKDITKWIGDFSPDILCLQELKAFEEQVDTTPFRDLGYRYIWNAAERPGYSGVATFIKKEPLKIKKGIDINKFDIEGRVIQTSYSNFELFNIYFPNGSTENRRVPYKLEFYSELLGICDQLHKSGKSVILTGDFNTAHKEIDLKNPKQNEKNTGFLPEEREWIDKYLNHGFVDIYRNLYPEEEAYTWWTYRFNSRARNVGWRLDYFLISSNLVDAVDKVVIHGDVMGSDHCPVTLVIKG